MNPDWPRAEALAQANRVQTRTQEHGTLPQDGCFCAAHPAYGVDAFGRERQAVSGD